MNESSSSSSSSPICTPLEADENFSGHFSVVSPHIDSFEALQHGLEARCSCKCGKCKPLVNLLLLVPSLLSSLVEILETYVEDRLLAASKLIDSFIELVIKHEGYERESFLSFLLFLKEDNYEGVDNSPLRNTAVCQLFLEQKCWFGQMLREKEEMNSLYHTFQLINTANEKHQIEGWDLCCNRCGVRTWYRTVEGSPIHDILLKGSIDSPLANVCALVNEIPLYPKWVPMLKRIELLKQVSIFRKIVHCHSKLLWPIADRDAVLLGYGSDNLREDGSVVIVVKDLPFGTEAEELLRPALPKGAVRMDITIAGFLLEPVDEHTTSVSVFANVNPKMAVVPYFLINFVTRQLCFVVFSFIKKYTNPKRFAGSEWDRARQNSPEFYAEVENRIAEHFLRQKMAHSPPGVAARSSTGSVSDEENSPTQEPTSVPDKTATTFVEGPTETLTEIPESELIRSASD